MDEARRAEILLEALPYIRRFSGKTIVIKYGGAAMEKAELSREFARDVTLLQYVGMRPVIVHGGGPQIGKTLADLGISSEFIDGHRVTDEKAMDVVEMVLAGKINKSIVSLINHEGGKAVGISGKDGLLAQAELHELRRTGANGETETRSLGRVGTIRSDQIRPGVVNTLDQAGFIPVIAPVAVHADGQSLNVNADTMAGAIAGALKAEKLILLTDTAGVLKDGATIARMSRSDVAGYVSDGTIAGGMLPKVDCCMQALAAGVARAHIIDGRVAHAVLLEIFTQTGVGTLITDEAERGPSGD